MFDFNEHNLEKISNYLQKTIHLFRLISDINFSFSSKRVLFIELIWLNLQKWMKIVFRSLLSYKVKTGLAFDYLDSYLEWYFYGLPID